MEQSHDRYPGRYTPVSFTVLFQIRRQKPTSRRTAGVSFPGRANTFLISTTSESDLGSIQLPVNTGTGKLANTSTQLETYIQGRGHICKNRSSSGSGISRTSHSTTTRQHFTTHTERKGIISEVSDPNGVYCVRNVVAHGDAREGSEGETGEWSG